MDLNEIRQQINLIDDQMRALFEQRMQLVKMVAEYKIANNMAIYDEKRENEVINTNVSKLENIQLQDYYRQYIIDLMNVSKAYQKVIIDKIV